MKSDIFSKIKIVFRRLRLIRVNRDLWVFLAFIGVAVAFWFLQTLNSDITASLSYKLTISDVPHNVIITSDVPDHVNVNYTGHGWDVLQNMMREKQREIVVSFKDIDGGNGIMTIEPSTFQRAVTKEIPHNLTYTSTTPHRLEIFYSNGEHKRVPINFVGRIIPNGGREHCATLLSPDSVDIYAPQHLLETIGRISTEQHDLINIEDTTKLRLALHAPNGVKVLPDTVGVTVCVDLFTEKTITTKIYCKNTPHNTIVRTFPQQAQVTCNVSSAKYSSLNGNDFIVELDYNAIDHETGNVRLQLVQWPEGVRNVRLKSEYVEFVLESQTE